MIEASSVGSMELSPHFANFRQHSGSVSSQHGGRDHHHSGSHHHGGGAGDGQMGSKVPDVASELQDAMSETVLGEETLLDGTLHQFFFNPPQFFFSVNEDTTDFFC